MQKRIKGRKFHRKAGPRKALLKTLASSLILKGKIETTEAKAKELSSFIEKKITKAGKGDLAARRELAKLFAPLIVKKLVNEIAPLYKNQQGGYTRVIKTGPRKSDSARMAIIELIEKPKPKTQNPKTETRK
ncbi:50S ribosomal protein L17 [Patescibacteria group bacterium]|nr:50S ribosomal protein L17 [Patescibacteria group bacterium]MBU4162432.1 50S ribosomal protein L17 [Patescibacteria group bacterium]